MEVFCFPISQKTGNSHSLPTLVAGPNFVRQSVKKGDLAAGQVERGFFKLFLIIGAIVRLYCSKLLVVPVSSAYYLQKGLSPVHPNVTMSTEVGAQSQQYVYTNPISLRVYSMLSRSPTSLTNTLKMFDFDGNLLATANTVVNEKPILHLKDPFKVLYSNDLADFRRLGLSLLNGVGTFTQEEVKNLVYGARCSATEPNTDYVYVASIPPNVQLFRPILTCLSCTLLSFQLSPVMADQPAVISPRTDVPQGVLIFTNTSMAISFSTTSLSEITRSNLSLSQGAIGANYGILDNLRPDFYFYLDSKGTISGFRIPASGSVWALGICEWECCCYPVCVRF